MTIAVDLDEVLANTMKLELAWFNTINKTNYSFKYYATHYWEFWGNKKEEIIPKMKSFYGTGVLNEAKPVPGAIAGIDHLSRGDKLVVITGRAEEIENETIDFLDKHYPQKFADVGFCHSFSLETPSIPKSELCRKFRAHTLIDDAPYYSLECAEKGVQVLLFNHPRNQDTKLIGNMERVYGWLGTERRQGVIDKLLF